MTNEDFVMKYFKFFKEECKDGIKNITLLHKKRYPSVDKKTLEELVVNYLLDIVKFMQNKNIDVIEKNIFKFLCKFMKKLNGIESVKFFIEDFLPKVLNYIFNIKTVDDKKIKNLCNKIEKLNLGSFLINSSNVELIEKLDDFKSAFAGLDIITRYFLNRVCVKLTDNLFAVYKVTLKGVTFEKFSDKCECEKNYESVCDLDEKLKDLDEKLKDLDEKLKLKDLNKKLKILYEKLKDLDEKLKILYKNLKDLNICICKYNKGKPIGSGANKADINVCFVEKLEYIINLLISGNKSDKDKEKLICKGDMNTKKLNINNVKNITEEKAPVLLKKCNSKIFINSSVILRIAEEINEKLNKKETK